MERARALIVIGASAGGIEPLSQLIGALPHDLPAAICVVVHIPPTRDSRLAQVIGRRSALVSQQAADGVLIEEGRVYVAAPDRHLWIHDGRLRLLYGPRENGLRPAIDPTLRSAASAYGARVVGVLLSGLHDDGVAGLKIVKDRGGATIVQDPDEADFPDLPLRALEQNSADHRCTIEEMIPLIIRLAKDRSTIMVNAKKPPTELEAEGPEVARAKAQFEEGGDPSTASSLTCPECGGAIWEFDKEAVLQYRCHTGHVYSTDSFVNEQEKTVEGAIWTALRALEEKEMLLRRLASRSHARGARFSATHFERSAEAVSEKVDLIRRAMVVPTPPPISGVKEPDDAPAAAGEGA